MGYCLFYDKQRISTIPKEIDLSNLDDKGNLIDIMNDYIIEKQKIKSICKIKNKDNNYEIGIFCKFNFVFDNEIECKEIHVLITHSKSILLSDIELNKQISFILNDKEYQIKLDKSRKIYKDDDETFIRIIEIKGDDNLEDADFLEINNINQINYNKVYLIYYSQSEIKSTLCEMELNKDVFILKENNVPEGGAVFNYSNHQIIGMINKNNTVICFDEEIDKYKRILKEEPTGASIKEQKIKTKLDKAIYIKQIMICFSRIEKLKNYFNENFKINNYSNGGHNENLAVLMNQFMKNDKGNDNDIIKKIEIKIEEIDKNILKDINYAKLTDFILTELHKELNTKGNINKVVVNGDYDEKTSFDNFEKEYLKHNDSQIQKLFFGYNEIITYFKCCGLKKYNFEECKYIYFDLEKITCDKNKIQNLIDEWENNYTKEKQFCSMCFNASDETFIQKQLYTSPEILVIIINNNKKDKINIDNTDSILSTQKYKFRLIISIVEINDVNNINFKIIYNNKNNFNIIEDNSLKEVPDKINSLIIYPCVLFYEKIEENKNKSNSSIMNMNFSNIPINMGNINNYNIDNQIYNYNFDYSKDNLINKNSINNKICNMNINNIFINQYFNVEKKEEFRINYNKTKSDDKSESNQITLYFHFSNGKPLYLDINPNIYFKDVVKELYSKYLWLNSIVIICYIFEGKEISFDKKVQEIGLKDNSIILIKEK